MKKFLCALIVVLTAITCCAFAFSGCGSSKTTSYEALELKKTEVILNKDNGTDISTVVDFEANNISETDEFVVTSDNEEIAWFDGDSTIKSGSSYGEANLEITVGNKKGTVKVTIVSNIAYYKEKAIGDDADESSAGYYKTAYYGSLWLINNLDSFKNPSTVSVSEVLGVNVASWSTFSATYFIMKIRAQNGFGGNTIDYYKVTSTSITAATVTKGIISGYYYNGELLSTAAGDSCVIRAVEEYIEENYS